MKRLMIGFGSAMALGFAALTHAATIHTTAAGDGFWHNESGSSWDYWDGSSASTSSRYTFWGTSDTLQYNTGYAQFDITGIGLGTTLASARIHLYITGAYLSGSTPDSGSVMHVANSGGANGNASQRLSGSELVTTINPGNTASWVSVDILSYLQADVDAGYSWSAFSFNPNTNGDYSNRNAGFSVTANEGGANAMYIEYSVIPESGLLPLAGLLLVACRRRRR